MSGRSRITLGRHLEWLALQGHELRIETPTKYERLWRRAREAGLYLGKLYVLRTSLEAHVGGSYQRQSGDIWVVHWEDQPEAGLRSLLHELVHASRRSPVPETIDADWDEEREFCPETKHECRARYERGESIGSVQTAAVSACKLPGPPGHECDAEEHAEQLMLFGELGPVDGEGRRYGNCLASPLSLDAAAVGDQVRELLQTACHRKEKARISGAFCVLERRSARYYWRRGGGKDHCDPRRPASNSVPRQAGRAACCRSYTQSGT